MEMPTEAASPAVVASALPSLRPPRSTQQIQDHSTRAASRDVEGLRAVRRVVLEHPAHDRPQNMGWDRMSEAPA